MQNRMGSPYTELTAVIDAHTGDDLFVESNGNFAINAPTGSFYCVCAQLK